MRGTFRDYLSVWTDEPGITIPYAALIVGLIVISLVLGWPTIAAGLALGTVIGFLIPWLAP